MTMSLKVLLIFARLWVRVFYRFEAHGIEHIPRQGGCVIVGSHSGKLLADAFAFLPVARRRIPVFIMPTGPAGFRQRGRLNWWARLIRLAVRHKLVPLIHIQRGGSSPIASNLATLQALKQGEAVMLFPEGEVSWDGRLKPARPGAAWMALRTGVPVVPCGISGTYDAWPRWRKRMHLTGKIVARLGPPFTLSDSTPEWIDDEMLDRAGERIMEEIGRLLN